MEKRIGAIFEGDHRGSMNLQSLKKKCGIALALYVVAAMLFYWIGGDQLRYRDSLTDMLTPGEPVGEITQDTVITQQIRVNGRLMGITLRGATYARQNQGTLVIELCSGGQTLDSRRVAISGLADNENFSVSFAPGISVPGGIATVRITAPDCTAGNAVTLYSGTTMSTARNQVAIQLAEDERVEVNGTAQAGALCMEVHSREELWFGAHYWPLAAAGLALLAGYCLYLIRGFQKGKQLAVLRVFAAFSKYGYLMRQLVSRDFKTKYKRSVLGVLWSFLNPLLTMTMQYIVFSTLFKSDIPNFAVYLLTGIVCFSYFSEATSMSLTSIVGNAPLITKVYVPKYIYPLTRVMSSTINFGLSLLPLLAVLLITRTPIRPAILLLPFGLFCLFALALGVGMLLAAAMVFFRDTQFLWGVVSMLWMYATPIFYPESIIPARFMLVYKLNPLYHIIRFIRTILINGVSPEPKAYALALIASVVPLIIGSMVFKRTQDRFVLNI